MAGSWLQQINWSTPQSVHHLITSPGGRTSIPSERGYYAFVEGWNAPSPNRCLYIGIAAGKGGLYSRLGSYLRGTVDDAKATGMTHEGKKRLSFLRIKGLTGRGASTSNTTANDKFLHVCWTIAPFDFNSASGGANEREVAYMLERALIDYYRPLYNTADWDRHLDFQLEDTAF